MKNKLEVLKSFDEIEKSLKANPKLTEYWENENRILEETVREFTELEKRMKMSPEKFRRPFDM